MEIYIIFNSSQFRGLGAKKKFIGVGLSFFPIFQKKKNFSPATAKT